MAFTLNIGEFDLGAGFIGRGNVIAGEAYNVGTSTTGVQGLLNTSGLEGISYDISEASGLLRKCHSVIFRSSSDNLISSFSLDSIDAWVFSTNNYGANPNLLQSSGRFYLGTRIHQPNTYNQNYYFHHINTSSNTSKILVNSPATTYYSSENYFPSTNWRFLARDHVTSLVHYPSTTEEGSVFVASCVNSTTQWGLWIAGEVGNRSGYFNQTQGYFSIVMLVNGGTTYFSAFSPAGANSATRNDAPQPRYNIVPAAGQSTTDDKVAKLLISRDLGSNYSAVIGEVPGFFYIDPNKAGFDDYTIGQIVNIDPVSGASLYDSTDNSTALIVGRWGDDQSITFSGTSATYTVTSAVNRATLRNGRKVRVTAVVGGHSPGTDYWIVNWNETTSSFGLAASEGGTAIDSGVGGRSGTLTAKAPLIAMRCY